MLDKAATADLPCFAGAQQTGSFAASSAPGLLEERSVSLSTHCFHCGAPCGASPYRQGDQAFCCRGCLTVFELLTENGLGDFYSLGVSSGVKGVDSSQIDHFVFADAPGVRELLVDFSDARLTRVRLRLPAIHCIACVWLLENLFRLRPGLESSQVNFPRKELSLSFKTEQVKLSEVLALLTALGYEPELKLSDLGPKRLGKAGVGLPFAANHSSRRLWLQIGVAGFAFGNTMLFSIAAYLGLDSVSGPGFEKLVGWLSLLLSIPVVTYSASGYWSSAWRSLRQGLLNIDVPIAAGILALAGQSTYQVIRGGGVGYFDSLAGLLFFLLCGRLFQQKTFDRISFDHDYRSFFPLSVRRRTSHGEESVAVSELGVGDRLLIRNGELIPADSQLVSGTALIDYSFVTGESEPVEVASGQRLYAGGRQVGGIIELETIKAVSQGYLTSLWDQEAFRKAERPDSLDILTNRYSQRFTKLVIAIAVSAALFWAVRDPSLSLITFTSVLIVACPCALALAAPFALGTAQRVLARRRVFLRNTAVLERLASAKAIVFDKTGTLTAGLAPAVFEGAPLSASEQRGVHALAVQSAHPQAIRVAELLANNSPRGRVQDFVEVPGLGLEGRISGHRVLLGSIAWLASKGVGLPDDAALRATTGAQVGSSVHLAIDSSYRGRFGLANSLRPDTENLMARLSADYDLALLSGDHDRERERFGQFFAQSKLHFNQGPLDKLEFIRRSQAAAGTVVMVGDGLNDAGALRQSDVGIAVVEKVGTFSPASDVIMAADQLPHLAEVMGYAKGVVRIVRLSFLLSAVYNAVGMTIAARGLLAPVVCAVLMPLSSITVVAFASGAAIALGKRLIPVARLSEARGEGTL